MKIKYIVLIIAALSITMVSAQETYTSKQAYEIFKNGDYKEAQKAYGYLLSKYDREPKYNYYFGICLLQNNEEISEAVKRLKYAAIKGVSRDAYYYLGRAYQLNYHFDEAVNQYKRFLKYASASDIRNDNAEKYIAECEEGLQQSTKVYDLNILSRDTVEKRDFIQHYHPVKDVGQIMHNSDFFESGIDPEGVLYLTERGDQVYFALVNEEGNRDVYRMEKLLDGWSDSKVLQEINSEWDDMYPYLLIDGQTLFFSSDREGGLGGFDIYKSTYDSETKTFSSPVNMGIPFNSPKDDFLFVTDEFNDKGWFASNRETSDSLVVVYGFEWNNRVVKNLVTDMNVVQEVAALSLSQASNQSANSGGSNDVLTKKKSEDDFKFIVADTLVYTQKEHFNSNEALVYFEQSQQLYHQKDSLSELMRVKRQEYARTNSDSERDELVNDILLLEKQVYGLDSKIEQSQNNARYTELNRIKELIKQGRYIAPNQVRKEVKSETQLKEILIPSEFTFYTDEEFQRHLNELDEMYQKLFSADEIAELKKADSLFVWGNILNLEASKLLEEADNQPAVKVPVVSTPFKKKEEQEEEESPVQEMIDKSKELKDIALELYHQSLNQKYKIYNSKITSIIKSNATKDYSYLEQPQVDANTYFKNANEMMNPAFGYNVETFEKAGSLKRSGVQEQEKSLFAFLDKSEGKIVTEGLEDEQVVGGVTQKTYQELQGMQDEVKEVKPAEVVEAAFKREYEYRIQIGVFRNEPNADALRKLPEITKTDIPSRDLTKYFAGRYASYAEATKNIDKVKSAGFSGAFVVVFKDGKQINLTDELKK